MSPASAVSAPVGVPEHRHPRPGRVVASRQPAGHTSPGPLSKPPATTTTPNPRMIRMRGAPRIVTGLPRIPLLALGIVLLALTAISGVAAQGDPLTLTSSDPRANAVLATAPAAITLTFSDDVDHGASAIRIIDREGAAIEVTGTTWDDRRTAVVPLPEDIPRGSYLVAWNVTPAAADQVATGFFGFTIGTDQDVAPVTIPDTGFADPAAITWTTIVANGAIVLGLSILITIWPASTVLGRVTSGTGRFPLLTVAATGAIVAGAGVLGRIGTLAWAAQDGDVLDRLATALGSDTGRLLLVTLVLVSIHSLALAITPGLTPTRWSRSAPWVSTLALTIPLPLLSHAPDEPAGRLPTLTVTWLVCVALALLIGGMICAAARGSVDRATRRYLGLASGIALPTMALGGVYLAWLYIGNRAALESTDYGTAALIAAMALLAFAVTIALAHGLTRRAAARVLLVPATVGVVLAGSVGGLLSLDTARAELTRDASQHTVVFPLGDDRAQLILAPGHAGVNHFRLEIDRASLPRQTTAELTMHLPALSEIGSETVTLSRVSGSAFEYHGTELSVADRWELAVTLAEPGREPVTADVALDLDRPRATTTLPTTPWRFTDFAGSAGVVLAAIGIAGIAIGVAAGRSPLRRESAGLGVAALALAAILLGQGRLDPILALGGDGEGGAINPDDLAMITRGEEVYRTNCLSCHGPDLRGDGPAADGMQPPPADFAEAHTMVHDEATLIYWVRNGKQGTAMPGFGDTLSDQDIRDVLSFIERRQRAFGGEGTVPDPVACTVNPRSEGDLNSLTALSIEEGPTGELIPADNLEVSSATVDEVTGVVTKMLACVNAGDLPRAAALYTDDALAWAFSAGREPFGEPDPLPQGDRIELVSMDGFTTLANDRVAVRVSLRDREGSLAPFIRDLEASDAVQDITIVLVPSGAGWLIDEVRT